MRTISISQKLHEDLTHIISEAAPGEQLLSEPYLAKQLGVSRATLREAMRTFESKGLIRRRQGSGTFVTRPSSIIDSGLEVLESIETIASRKGLHVKMGDLKIEHRQANEKECELFNFEVDCNVIQVSRVIETDDRQVAFLVDILPETIISPEELDSGFSGSVLDFLIQRGDPILSISRTDVSAIDASSELARALQIQRNAVLLYFSARLYDDKNRVVDYSLSYFLPGYFNFHVIRRI